MRIEESYKYRKNQIIYVGKNLPEESTVLEVMQILIAQKGYDLVRISDKENVGTSVWLKDGDTKENYQEVEQKEKRKWPIQNSNN